MNHDLIASLQRAVNAKTLQDRVAELLITARLAEERYLQCYNAERSARNGYTKSAKTAKDLDRLRVRRDQALAHWHAILDERHRLQTTIDLIAKES